MALQWDNYDVKSMLSKCPIFSGKDDEWPDFKFNMLNWLTMLDASADAILTTAEQAAAEVIVASAVVNGAVVENVDSRKLNSFLFSLFGQTCRNKALREIKSVPNTCGLEA